MRVSVLVIFFFNLFGASVYASKAIPDENAAVEKFAQTLEEDLGKALSAYVDSHRTKASRRADRAELIEGARSNFLDFLHPRTRERLERLPIVGKWAKPGAFEAILDGLTLKAMEDVAVAQDRVIGILENRLEVGQLLLSQIEEPALRNEMMIHLDQLEFSLYKTKLLQIEVFSNLDFYMDPVFSRVAEDLLLAEAEPGLGDRAAVTAQFERLAEALEHGVSDENPRAARITGVEYKKSPAVDLVREAVERAEVVEVMKKVGHGAGELFMRAL